MSFLRVFPENNSSHFEEFKEHYQIAHRLQEIAVRFERWTAAHELPANATQEEILSAYDHSLQRIMKEVGFVTADVISVHSATPNIVDLRKKFLDEHTHTEDEARFFVDGSGLFYIHVNSKVYVLLCEKGDFIDIPANTRHWFDMGPKPTLKAIRTFNRQEGWVANFTGSDIASHFPRFEDLIALPV